MGVTGYVWGMYRPCPGAKDGAILSAFSHRLSRLPSAGTAGLKVMTRYEPKDSTERTSAGSFRPENGSAPRKAWRALFLSLRPAAPGATLSIPVSCGE